MGGWLSAQVFMEQFLVKLPQRGMFLNTLNVEDKGAPFITPDPSQAPEGHFEE